MCLTALSLMLADSPVLADIGALVQLAGVILVVALGLGAVIFVHELGHFLVAKACGVKCEKFMIGFDVGGYKISRQWGETEYGIGIVPLGGYVKMLGQDDDPAHIAEEMKRCQIAAASPDAVEVTGPNGERYCVDRRSYLAKSVPQRMAIISAGVVMNVIFAFIFATIAYGLGVKYMPCIVSETVPGSPAWRAGLEPGDEIVQIGEQKNPTFTQLKGDVTLGDMENGVPIVVRRAADGDEVSLTLRPEQNQGRGLATIGIINPWTMMFRDEAPAIPESPAAKARPIDSPAEADGAKPQASGFQGGDTIVRVGDIPVSDHRALVTVMAREPDQPLRVTVRRPAAGSASPSAAGNDEPAHELTFEVPAHPMRHVGLVLKMGPIVGVQANSPAAAAGVKVGDVLIAVNGQPLAAAQNEADWNPDSLADRMRAAAVAGETITLTVQRGSETVDIRVTPRAPAEFQSNVQPRVPLGVPALGIAYRVESEVVAVMPDSPAAQAQLRAGDRLLLAKFIYPQLDNGKTPDPTTIRLAPAEPSWLTKLLRSLFGREEPADAANSEPSWPAVFDDIQHSPQGTVLELTYQRGAERLQAKFTPVEAEGLFVADRGFLFMPLERVRVASTFAEQVRYGREETVEALGMVYRFLQKIGTQVPVTALGGPVMIAKAAGYSAYEGLPQLLIFLTMLSANLAVLNFLPIPLLDGGHMVFLAYEGLRGRPASEKFVVAMHTAGFVFIVSLMLFVLALDFNLIDRNL